MMRIISILTAVCFMVFLFASCEKENSGEGTVRLSITDAPVDTDGITEVNVTVTEVHYGKSESEWEKFVLESPQIYNLLDLQNGISEMIGLFEMTAGAYTQVRFILDASVAENGTESNAGCYLVMEDGSQQILFVPSGTQSGYKAVGSFDVPVNGTVDITADFDARKSIVKAGNSGKYLLKPTIRLIVNNQAGHVAGEVINVPEGSGVIVYAYVNDTYDATEAAEPEPEEVRFPNALTSGKVDENNSYHLAYLAEGSYDLIVVSTIDGVYEDLVGVIEDVEVYSGSTTELDIDYNEFEE